MMTKRMNRRPVSLALRVTVLVGIATTLVFMISALFIERSIEQHFAEQDLGELQAVSQSIGTILGDIPLADSREVLQQRLAGAVAGHHGVYFAVLDKQGQRLYATADSDLSEYARIQTAVSSMDADTLRIWSTPGKTYRGELLNMSGYTVLVATAMDFHLRYLEQLKRGLWIGTFVASIIAIFVAWLAVQRGHAPIRRISTRMRGVTSERLDIRLDPGQVPIELAELVSSFNAMLEHIGESYHRLSHFSADIAHELRTPVTNLTTQTQVALSKVRSIEAYREILYSNLEEFQRMAKMIGDMLFLAQADHDLIKPEQGDVNLAVEARALFEYFEAWADDRGISLVLEGATPIVRGDRLTLRRALSNLISNAIPHTPSGGAITVRLTIDSGIVVVEVENPGPDIPTEHLSRLFDRFYRVDPSRQYTGDGVGLGLAIVKSIIDAHSGTISVTSINGLTRFRLSLPGKD